MLKSLEMKKSVSLVSQVQGRQQSSCFCSLLEPTKGQILVDGQPLSDPAIKKGWQSTIGFVPQGLFIISGSLANNVAFGEDHYNEEAVKAALSKSQLGDFMKSRAE